MSSNWDQSTGQSEPPPILPPPLPEMQPGWLPYAITYVRPRVWPVFVAVVLMFAATLAIGIVTGICIVVVESARDGQVNEDNATAAIEAALSNPAVALPMMFAISLVTGAIAVIAGYMSPAGIRRRLTLRPSTANPFTMLLLCIGTVCVGGCAEALLVMLSKAWDLEPGGTLKLLEDLVHRSGQFSLVLTAIVIAIGPGIGEELLFRGYAQTRFHQRWGPRRAILFAAILFALAHADLMHSTLTLPLGAYMGWAAYRTGSTRTSIICHIFNNFAAVMLSQFSMPSIEDVSMSSLWLWSGIYLVVGLTCTIIAHYILPPAPEPELYVPQMQPVVPTYAAPVYAPPIP